MNEPAISQRAPLNLLAARFAGFTERYVLSFVYFAFAYSQWGWVRIDWSGIRELLGNPSAAAAGYRVYVGYFSTNATMFTLDLIMGLVLLIGRRAAAAPRSSKEIFVPLAASYYFLLFSGVASLPDRLWWLTQSMAPDLWRDWLNFASLIIAALGTILSLWGLVSLGRSFGIFVAVRTVVLRGPYRFVRHPMYVGYIIMTLALLLAEANLAMAILMPIQAALFAWRAKLEEARLSEFSEAYREYQRTTGFFFPRLRHSA